MSWRCRTADLPDEAATLSFGRLLGEAAGPGDVFALRGPLGAGKTTWTRGFARGLGVPEGVPVRSPSFSLQHELPGRLPCWHVDLYRLQSAAEAADLDAFDAMGRDVVVVEWADRFPALIPSWAVWVDLDPQTPGRRATLLEPQGRDPVSWTGSYPAPIPGWAPPPSA